jgi:acyl-CoA synthetase (AMP-forming)/AMP-acid ligase II
MNLAAFVARHAAYQPSKPAIEGGSEQFDYAGLDASVRRLARRLRSQGAAPGDLVGLKLRDTPQHLIALLAIARIGAVALPLDWRAAGPEIARIAEIFKPGVVLLDKAGPLPPTTTPLILDDLSATEPDDLPPADVTNAPLVYGLTSGTTGTPKGIVTTHEEMFGRFVIFAVERLIARDDRFMIPLPLVFDAGRAVSWALLTLGATVVLFPTLFEAIELVEAVNSRDVSGVILAPKSTRAILGLRPQSGSHLMPKLRVYISTAGKLQPEERAAIRARVAPHMIDYYGTTGGGPVAIVANEKDGATPTALGRPAPGIELQIVDEDHKPLPDGTVGRVRIRGPGVTKTFAGAVAATSDENIRDGWYYPGDLGRFETDGTIHLTGRTADLIKRGGLMIHAQEVEYVLSLHPAIVEAAVVGMPSAEGDEEVVAFVVARATVDPTDVIKHCRQNLTGYKVPQRIVAVDSLPRNTTGKVVKAELRKLA